MSDLSETVAELRRLSKRADAANERYYHAEFEPDEVREYRDALEEHAESLLAALDQQTADAVRMRQERDHYREKYLGSLTSQADAAVGLALREVWERWPRGALRWFYPGEPGKPYWVATVVVDGEKVAMGAATSRAEALHDLLGKGA